MARNRRLDEKHVLRLTEETFVAETKKRDCLVVMFYFICELPQCYIQLLVSCISYWCSVSFVSNWCQWCHLSVPGVMCQWRHVCHLSVTGVSGVICQLLVSCQWCHLSVTGVMCQWCHLLATGVALYLKRKFTYM